MISRTSTRTAPARTLSLPRPLRISSSQGRRTSVPRGVRVHDRRCRMSDGRQSAGAAARGARAFARRGLVIREFRALVVRDPNEAAREFLGRSNRAAVGIAPRFRLHWDVADDLAQESYGVAASDNYAAIRRARPSTRLD